MYQKILTIIPSVNKKLALLLLVVLGVVLVALISVFMLFSNRGFEEEKVFVPPKEEVYVPDQLVVEFVNEEARQQVSARLSELGVIRQEKVFESEDPILSNFYTLYLKEGSNLDEIEKVISEMPEIKSTEKNDIMYALATPNDPQYPSMYGLSKIEADKAWDLTKGSNSVIVGVVDTGIDYNHPDFAGRNIIKGYDFSTCDEVNPYSGTCSRPKSRDDDPYDDAGHGTHVSGTIGASTNNGLGIAGINWEVTIMAVKVFGAGGSGTMNDVVEGMRYAVDNGAKVVNMSLGGPGACSSLHQASIDYALSKGVVVVVAAGNDSSDSSGFTPASCAGILTVGASTSSDSRASFSNFGSGVDIAAPGASILSTVPGGSFSIKNGTSMATPHVAGVAALLLAANSGLSPQQAMDCIVQNGDPISTDRPIGPRLNANKTLSACSNSTPTNPTPTTSGPTPTGQPGTFSVSGSVILDTNTDGQINTSDTPYQNANLTLSGAAGGSKTTGTDGKFNFTNLPAGAYTLTLNILTGTKSTSFTLGPDRTVDFLVGALSSGQPTIIPNPTGGTSPGTGNPTPTPSSSSGRITVTPTPVPYSCYVDPKCLAEGENIHLCQLICTPKQ